MKMHESPVSNTRDEDPDPLIFGLPEPLLFSTDPDPDPTCNNGYIKLFSLEQNINQNHQIQATTID